MKSYIPAILLVLLCVILFGFNLGDLGLVKGDENYYFSSSRRMIREGDWITPRYHHHIRYEKPVLYYWTVAAFFKVFGVSWVAARATSVLFATLTVLLTYLLSLRFFRRKTAYLAAIILASSFLFFQYSRLAVIDMTFLFLITLSLFLFIKGDRERKKIYSLISFIPLGLSVMAKGPLGLVIVALTAFVYIIMTKRYRLLRWSNLAIWILGIIIFLLIALPWPLRMYQIHGDEYINHIWKVEAVDKAVGSMLNFKDIANLPWFAIKYLGYYIPVVLFTFAPWSLLLPFSLFKKIEANEDEDRVFVLSWFWVVFLLFTVVSFKHTHYMLLLSPPLAMIVANFFSGRKNMKLPAVIAAITIAAYLTLTGFILPVLDDGTTKSFSLVLASEVKKDEEIGLASKGFNLKKLGVSLNNLVLNSYELGGDDLAQYRLVSKDNMVNFLQSDKRVFCLITKRDYDRFVPKELKDRLYILETNLKWKRKFNFRESLPLILKADLSGLKEEAYLVSNRRQ